ncbi:putative two-component system response regulator [Crocosphaera subtropica ATCC 51142]|uniref:Two-component system response regulator n=1 Tax=Crocosphaera subtropica (strain ATCC 51142 / BH68) TaxID=43989 RepID=B1X1N2_CROS5|nr:response regulator [Crocosphaera subtropica]ACB53062.1 putative two-component system response regulator [Crocosphaera subtropica ATCC 51142]
MSNLVSKSFLLLVEDSDEDFTAFLRFSQPFLKEHSVKRCRNGEETIQFLERVETAPYSDISRFPTVIILDLNLSGVDGREILIRIQENPQWQKIPTLIFSSSNDPRDINFCYQHGAKSYILKPMDISHLKKTIQMLWEYWFNIVVLPSK